VSTLNPQSQTGEGRNPRPYHYHNVFIMHDRVVFEIARATMNHGAQYQSFAKHRYDQDQLDSIPDWSMPK